MNKPEIKNIIQRCGCDKVLPLCLVYICYIVLHGHLSPGGGFQGGVLMVAAVLLVFFGHGYQQTIETFSFHLLHETEALASVFYVALGMLGVAVGAQFAQNILFKQRRRPLQLRHHLLDERHRRRQGHHRRRLHRAAAPGPAPGEIRERGEVSDYV